MTYLLLVVRPIYNHWITESPMVWPTSNMFVAKGTAGRLYTSLVLQNTQNMIGYCYVCV